MKYLLSLLLLIIATNSNAQTLHRVEELLQTPQLIEKDLEYLYSSQQFGPQEKTRHADSLLKLKSYVDFLPLENAPFQNLVVMAQYYQWKRITALSQDLAQSCTKRLPSKDCKYLLNKIYDLISQNELDPIKLRLFLIQLKKAEKIIEVLGFYQPSFISQFNEQRASLMKSPPSAVTTVESKTPSPQNTFFFTKITAVIGSLIFVGLFLKNRIQKNYFSTQISPESEGLQGLWLQISPTLQKLYETNNEPFPEKDIHWNTLNHQISLRLSTGANCFNLASLMTAQEQLMPYKIELSYQYHYSPSKGDSYFLMLLH